MSTLNEIAARLQGYDAQALRADDAKAFLRALVPTLETCETVPLMQALDRTLAADVLSPINVPAHDNSAMDGYAFASHDLQSDAETRLRVVGNALAGSPWSGTLTGTECIRITTGAVMPPGLDTVAPMELVQVDQDGQGIRIPPKAIQPGDNRRFCGEDLRAGQIALGRGTRLGPAALGLLASLGHTQALVLRKLRVAYFSTGDEILNAGEAQRVGTVYDSNRYTLCGLLSRLGVELLDMGLVRDDPAAMETAFRQAVACSDAVVTSGGVSVGEADYTKAMLQKLAGKEGGVAFWRIAIRPGRPMAVGQMGKTILFGLPGNPVAAMVTFLQFVRPALLQMMGATSAAPPMLRARLAHAIGKRPGRTEYQRAIVSHAEDGSLQVHITGQQGSGVLRSMVEANGLMVLGHAQGDLAAGQEVDVQMFDGVI